MSAPIGEGIVRRERRRKRSFALSKEDQQKIADRVCKFYDEDIHARTADRDLRLQRYAKYRQWRSGSGGWPWAESSDQAVPDMMEASIRMQDTIHNAVMSARPIVVSRALSESPENNKRQEAVDALHDTQFFVEQEGEKEVEKGAESFCNDPAVTFFVPWVQERREVTEVRTFDPIPPDKIPRQYFADLLKQNYPSHQALAKDEEGWDWEISLDDDKRKVKFYTKANGKVELVMESNPVVFDGPRVMVKAYDDVICPPSVANLDIPSPKNPDGSPHVILRDNPTKDQIKRLARRGDEEPFYDLLTQEDLEKLENAPESQSYREKKDQEAIIEGVSDARNDDPSQQRLTQLVCFDIYDVDDDGQTEDVIFWVLYETKRLCRARLLTEVYPGPRPERPFGEASFLPVGGRRAGISLLETMEGLHDFLKEATDQMVDNGTLANLPWFTYRAGSSLKPETLRPGPGDGIPTNDPKNDIVWQKIDNSGQAFWINLIAIIRQQSERLTLQGDLQAGRVPGGASSALRTLGGIQTLLSQGEARPERILRRFFVALRKVFRLMHRLNRHYLPPEKRFRASGKILEPGQDPYYTVATADVDVDMEFDFHANVLNSSRQAIQQGLQALLGIYVSDIAIQLGITTPDTVYRLLRDLGDAYGQDADKYLNKPTPTAGDTQIEAAEAMLMLMQGVLPMGAPLEGAQEHLLKLQEIMERETFAGFPPQHISLLRVYLQQVSEMARQEAELAARMQAAGGVGLPLGQRGRPPQGPPGAPAQPPLQGGQELLDESLPTAGGGAAR